MLKGFTFRHRETGRDIRDYARERDVRVHHAVGKVYLAVHADTLLVYLASDGSFVIGRPGYYGPELWQLHTEEWEIVPHDDRMCTHKISNRDGDIETLYTPFKETKLR
jgi:hypothetical protein